MPIDLSHIGEVVLGDHGSEGKPLRPERMPLSVRIVKQERKMSRGKRGQEYRTPTMSIVEIDYELTHLLYGLIQTNTRGFICA